MRERIAGCLICLVAMLTWEALSASSHGTVRIPPPALQSGPLVELSQGSVGAAQAEVPSQLASIEPGDAAVFEWVEELLPVVAAPCEPVVVARCDADPKAGPRSAYEFEDDAGVGASAVQMSSVTPSGKSG